MITINQQTKDYIEKLSQKYGVRVIWNESFDATFQEQVYRQEREMILQESITIDWFNRLFEQHGVDYDVERDQEMFIFNALHGIGHFELNLWSPKTDDRIVDRLANFNQDKKVDEWAYKKLCELREDSGNYMFK